MPIQSLSGWGCEKAFDGILDKGLLYGPGGRVTGWATQVTYLDINALLCTAQN